MRIRTLGVFVLAAAALTAPVRAQRVTDTPVAVIQQLFRALYGNDSDAFNRLTIDHPLRSTLTRGGTVNRDRLRRLDESPETLQIRALRPVLVRGVPIASNAAIPVGATALYRAVNEGSPLVVPVVRQASGWRVDVRWWIAMSQMAAGASPLGEVERPVRGMLAAMLRLDRERAGRYLSDARNLELLFAAAPSSREPSGVLDATVEEMPLVEIGSGEFYPLPSGRVVEGGSTETRRVLVGMFGPTEMPFVLRRVGADWRVEADPYFLLLMR